MDASHSVRTTRNYNRTVLYDLNHKVCTYVDHEAHEILIHGQGKPVNTGVGSFSGVPDVD